MNKPVTFGQAKRLAKYLDPRLSGDALDDAAFRWVGLSLQNNLVHELVRKVPRR